MRFLILGLALMSSSFVFARQIDIPVETLGVKVVINDSKSARPIQSITDAQGIDYQELVDGINEEISFHTLNCASKIGSVLGCDWVGFEPIDFRILPYSAILYRYPHTDLALIIKGRVSGHGGEKTFFIPIELLVQRKRENKSMYWWLTDGGVRSNEDYKFNRVDLSRIFVP